MIGQNFAFPPPPPPPPQASQSYLANTQPQQGFQGHSARSNRGRRGGGINGRRNTRAGPKGGFPGSSHYTPSRGGNQDRSYRLSRPQNIDNDSEKSHQKHSGYSLPNFPTVQLPQVPPNIRQDYAGQPSNRYPSNVYAQHPRSPYSSHEQPTQQYHSEPQRHLSYSYDLPVDGMLINGKGPQRAGSQLYNSVEQQMPMASTSHFGFGGGDYQSHPSHPLPQPTSSGTISIPNNSPSQKDLGSYLHNPLVGMQAGAYNPLSNHTGHRGRSQKYGHREASGRARNHKPRPQAAPAIPSFGSVSSLPVKPPAPQDFGKRPRKKKRKHNQLGLTPKTDQHEPSEEEDDADEESRFAAAVAGPHLSPQSLQFAYKGQTSTLFSSSDIAAWIEERKRRFPTKARVAEAAERKQQQDELQTKVSQARRKAQEQRRAEAKERQKSKAEGLPRPKKSKQDAEDAEGAALKAKRKVEKLRKKLQKEEKRAAKAEAKASSTEIRVHGGSGEDEIGKRKRSYSADSGSMKVADANTVKSEDKIRILVKDAASTLGSDKQTQTNAPICRDPDSNDALEELKKVNYVISDPLTPTSQAPASDDDSDAKLLNIGEEQGSETINQTNDKPTSDSTAAHKSSIQPAIEDSKSSSSDFSSEDCASDSETLTSSSGSSSSDSDSDDDAPPQMSSKQNGPERVAAPKREKLRHICRNFLRHGRCKRGDNCRYRHELPERGSRTTPLDEDKKTASRVERVSLHQRLVNQEKEKADHEVVKAIIQLGEKGLLNPDIPKESAES